MLGYSEMREVLLWVQTTEAAKVQFDYWSLTDSTKVYRTEATKTRKADAFSAKLIADEVQPGQTYRYTLKINDQQVSLPYPTTFQSQALWRWREDPPSFKLALGSCFYVNEPEYDRPGRSYGSNFQIVESIHQQRPDLMIWLGDNTYLREADWFSRTGILHRYTHTRSLPELQALLASTHHYAIWDDHDFGPNNSDRSFIHKDKTLEAFQLFWGNPTFGLPGQKGITTYFQWNDIDFFLLDNRYYRSPNDRKTTEHTLLGKEQLEWIIDALTFSRAPFKMVAIGGQVLNTVKKYETYSNLAPEEKAYLLKRIAEEKIKGVVFLTGDRHKTELSQFENEGLMVYDLTISPLTSGVSIGGHKEKNGLRVPNSVVEKHNFGLIEFSGPRKERQMSIQVIDADGQEVWKRVITQEDL
ncbi:MAG: alkaline phosphatase D family protein [Bacteroidota bacterium]